MEDIEEKIIKKGKPEQVNLTKNDRRTIRISFGIATPIQVATALKRAAQRASKIIGYVPDYRINIAYNSEGNNRSWGYIYTPCDRFFSLLTGESIYEEQPDPEWTPPTYAELNWLTVLAGDPESFVGKPASLWQAPVIRKPKPLLNLNSMYEYTPEQKKRITHRFGIIHSEGGYIKFEPALPPPSDCNVLISHKPPPKTFSRRSLERIFDYYSTSADKTYPRIEYTDAGLVKVTYDLHSTDAMFALLMTTMIYDGEPGKSPALGFSYWRKSDL